MSLLYLDTCCIIYLIEAAGPFHAAVVRRVMAHNAVPGTTLVTSRLARLECRTKPVREADVALLARYEALLPVLNRPAAAAHGDVSGHGRGA